MMSRKSDENGRLHDT